jgi:hypothetical protein
MLIQSDDIEAEFLGIAIFIDIVIVIVGRLLTIEVTIRDGEVSAVLQNFFLR